MHKQGKLMENIEPLCHVLQLRQSFTFVFFFLKMLSNFVSALEWEVQESFYGFELQKVELCKVNKMLFHE